MFRITVYFALVSLRGKAGFMHIYKILMGLNAERWKYTMEKEPAQSQSSAPLSFHLWLNKTLPEAE